jgi:hypothetical protein
MAAKIISELDFDTIKSSFKEFLSSQEEFTDYNFEGSNFNILLNILAYNTHYEGFYQNMALNEAFLDSAVKRGSVASRGKELGYIPRSVKSSEIIVNVLATNLLPEEFTSSMTLARGTRFRGVDATNTNSYYFVVTDSVTADINDDSFNFVNVKLKEGSLLYFNFQVNKNSNPNLIFEIPHDNVDTSTIRVRVQESAGSQNLQTYTFADNVYSVDSESFIFYLQENYRGKYEIQFGDGVLGKTLETGNIVLVDYLVSSGSAANGLSKIVGIDPIGVVSVDRAIISVLSPSSGGSSRESIESIRLNVPAFHAAQNRAVTVPDYIAFLIKNYGDLEAINVWGGEDNDPPIYGKVFVSLKPMDGLFISDFEKKNIIKALLKDSGVATVTPEFVDPIFLFVACDVTIRFDETKTVNTSNTIKNYALARIDNYFSRLTRKFNQLFTRSNFLKELQSIDDSIESIIIDIYVSHHATVIQQSSQGVEFSFNNKIVPASFSSNKITIEINQISYDIFIRDKSTDFKATNGVLYIVDSNDAILNPSAGTIDYVTGSINLNTIKILNTNTSDDYIIFNAKIVDDITASKNQLIIKDNVLFGKYEKINTGTRVSASEV